MTKDNLPEGVVGLGGGDQDRSDGHHTAAITAVDHHQSLAAGRQVGGQAARHHHLGQSGQGQAQATGPQLNYRYSAI